MSDATLNVEHLAPETASAPQTYSRPLERTGRTPRFPILLRYVAREIQTPFWVGLFVFTGVLFLARSLKLIDLVVNKSVPLADILLLFSYVIPGFLEVAIPMALLLAIILAFGRLSADSELVVMRATGISMRQLLYPVLLVASLCFALALLLAMYIRPWANYQLGLGVFEIAKLRASSGLSEGVFNDFGPLTIYAERVQQNGHLSNVIIADRRNPDRGQTFIAKYGQVVSDTVHRALALQLYEGSIQEGSGLNFNVTHFQINTLTLPQSEMFDENPSREGKRSGEMYIYELRNAIHTLSTAPGPLSKDDRLQLARWQVELHRRFSIPSACFCVALVAMALGIQPSRGGKSWGASANIMAGILLILTYYLLLALVSAVGSQAIAPVASIMWIPNLLFLILGIYLFRKMGSERWLAVSQALGEGFAWLGRKLRITSRNMVSET